MKIRWLMVFACLLITACEKAETTTENAETAKKTIAAPAETMTAKNGEETKKTSKKDVAETTPAKTAPAESSTAETTPAETTPVEAKTPEEMFTDVKGKFESDRADFMKRYRAAPAAEQGKLRGELPRPDDYAEAFFNIAEDHPESDAAVDALLWVAKNTRGGEANDEAMGLLMERHVDDERLQEVCMSLGYAPPSQQAEDQLNQLVDKSPHDSVKAAATFALATYLSGLDDAKEWNEKNPDEDRFDDDEKSYLESRESEPMVIETLYQALITNYADLKPRAGSKRTYKDIAEGALFEINNLAIGKMAPDIEGEDLDGESFKLSDYRGKVVVLDFWGDW